MPASPMVAALAVLLAAPAEAAPAQDGKAPEAPSRHASYAVVPGPFYNPNLGLGIMVVPMVTFQASRDDEVSPPSLATLPTMYSVLPPLDEASTRYSYAIGAATKLFVAQDRWRVAAAGGYFDLFRQFRGIGGDGSGPEFDYREQAGFLFAQATRQAFWRPLYLGLLAGYMTFRDRTDDPAGQEALELLGTGSDWHGEANLGVVAQIDTKNSQYYPSSGVDLNLRAYGSAFTDADFLVAETTFKQFFELARGARLVLAYEIFGQFGLGDVPLAYYATYGSHGTTLGYSNGEYVDKMMAGIEAELRWLFWWRLGLEGGAGIGKVFASLDEFGPQPWLPGAWASLTYQVMQESDIRARLSLAVGKSSWALYFAVGETF